jgi:hypothetical protein
VVYSKFFATEWICKGTYTQLVENSVTFGVFCACIGSEKIKPEKVLERAEKEIKKYKFSIREIICEFNLFFSTCQCGSHQSCLECPEKKGI